MIKALLISPHFDDAILSAGQLMAGRPDCVVATVYAAEPLNWDRQTEYDKKCGFDNAKDSVAVRALEDMEACALLQARAIHMEFVDGQYNEPSKPKDIKKELTELVNSDFFEFVVAPLGLDHPDHKVISDILLEMKKEGKIKRPLYLWEDLPTRVVYPEQAFERIQELGLTEQAHIGTGPIADKVRALWCYRSQIRTGILDPYVMYVNERFWKV